MVMRTICKQLLAAYKGDKMKNEKGYTLLTVLLMMILMTTFGLILASAALNNAKQNNITEKEVQLTDLAEMGVVQYQNKILSLLKGLIPDDPPTEPNDPPAKTIAEKLEDKDSSFDNLYGQEVKAPTTEDLAKSFKITSISIHSTRTTLTIDFESKGCIDYCSNQDNSYTITSKMEFKFNTGKPNGNNPPFDSYEVCTFKSGNSGQLDGDCKFIGDLTQYIKLHGETVHIVGNADLKYIDFTNGGKVCVYGDLVNPNGARVTGNKHTSSIYAYHVSPDIPVINGELDADDESGNGKDKSKGIKVYTGKQTTNISCLGKDIDFGDSWQTDTKDVKYQ